MIVVGGGIVGRSIAWRTARTGARVAVVDADDTGRAWWAAAGMLTPVTEAWWGEVPLIALSLASMRRWPDFAAELEAASGTDVGFERSGVLVVGVDSGDVAQLDDLQRLQQDCGLDSRRLRARECRALEPLLAPQVRGGVLAPGDGAVDPRAVVAALVLAGRAAGVEEITGRVRRIVVQPDSEVGRTGVGGTVVARTVVGVDLEGGEHLRAGTVVLAGGAWSSLVEGLGTGSAGGAGGGGIGSWSPVHPVHGEVLRLRERTAGHAPSVVVRALVHGRHVYVVPRRSGEIVVGATSTERGFDPTVTAGGVHDLLRDAVAVLPALAEAELVEVTAGLRPATPDNAPVIGPVAPGGPAGLVMATGHFRHGVLLAPLTAEAVAALVSGGRVPHEVTAAASPTRFAPVTA